jgi:hypothetical protein
VIASRNAIGGKLVHSVTFYTGDVLRGQGTVLEAQRLRLHGAWLDLVGGPDEPLIHIRGNRLPQSATLTRPPPNRGAAEAARSVRSAAAREAVLEATCAG